MNSNINYELWDLKEKTFFEAACLWYDIDPYNTKDIPQFRRELTPGGWLITTKEDLWSKIRLIESLIGEAAAKKIKGYELSPHQWMADSPHKIGNEHLRYFAENIVKDKQIPFLSCSSEDLKRLGLSEAVRVLPFFLLTPEERQKHPHMAKQSAIKVTEEQPPAQQNQKGIPGEKGDWRIIDFRQWDVEQEFQFEEAAYLYCEADPTGYVENLNAIVQDEKARLFYPDMGTPFVNKACGVVPNKTWEEIKEVYKLLLQAAKKGSLYRPSDGGKLTNGRIHRDDLRYFFAERLGQKPKFLFPDERQGLLKEAISTVLNASSKTETKHKKKPEVDNTALLKKLPKETYVKEAADILDKTEKTIRTWCKEGRLPANKNPGGKDWIIYGKKD